LLFAVKAEKAANYLGYHQFFVRANNVDRIGPAQRKSRALPGVALFLEVDSKENPSPVQIRGANYRRVLANATREHQCVYSANAAEHAPIHFLA
jgi:hypothetical protein